MDDPNDPSYQEGFDYAVLHWKALNRASFIDISMQMGILYCIVVVPLWWIAMGVFDRESLTAKRPTKSAFYRADGWGHGYLAGKRLTRRQRKKYLKRESSISG